MIQEFVDAVEWARSNPRMFFGRDRPAPGHLLSFLVADVIELGGGECVMRRAGQWWIVGSDVDWLNHERYTVAELFNRVVAAPQHGDNQMRGEVLVHAFCADVCVTGPEGVMKIVGSEPEEAVLMKTAGMRRAIVFRLQG